jgi:hypothetical protein
MSKQVEAELLASAFRKKINDGNIYIIVEKDGEVVELRKAKYFSNGEVDELKKIASVNKAKHDKIRLEKEQLQKEHLEQSFHGLQAQLDIIKAKNEKLFVLLLKSLKVLYGTSEEDFALLIAEIEKELS